MTGTPTIAATATPAPVKLPALAVKGTQIVDAGSGNAVTLVGVTRSSLEYECTGDGHFQLADFRAMSSWGINVVRIPLWSREWLNLNNDCPNYQQTVQTAIANAEAAGLYVIIDLHWDAPYNAPDSQQGGTGSANWQYPMPDTTHDTAFWMDIARIYGNDPDTIFELLGEPHVFNWTLWLNGGPIATPNGTYQAIGMKPLVARVRAIAPNNLIIVSGDDWGYDLSGITRGYAIPSTNIVYGTHPFDYSGKQPANWPYNFGVAAQHYAVIATEFGEYDCGSGYVSQAIAYFKRNHMSWLAWEWGVPSAAIGNPCGTLNGPFLLADWLGTPSKYGAYLKQQMLLATKSA